MRGLHSNLRAAMVRLQDPQPDLLQPLERRVTAPQEVGHHLLTENCRATPSRPSLHLNGQPCQARSESQ